jgi:hypothetical protein
MSQDKLDLLKAELDRRKKLEYPVQFTPYVNRDQTESWQSKVEKLLAQDDTFQVIASGANGIGKDLKLDCLIATPTGFRAASTIKIGDVLCAPDGTTTKVIGVYPQAKHKFYKVTFSDGETIECGDNHLWEVLSWTRYIPKELGNCPHRSKTPWVLSGNKHSGFCQVLNTEQLKESLTINGGKSYNHSIPLCELYFESQEVPLNPYSLGCLIGDGSLGHSTPKITTMDSEILDHFLKNHEVGASCRENGRAITFSILNIYSTIRQLNLETTSYHKHIPDIYKFNSKEVRLAVLQGLMDTDGYIGTGSCLEYSTTSKKLANDISFLVRSLGGLVNIKPRLGKYRNKEGKIIETTTNYRVSIQLKPEIKPFRLTRKLEKYTGITKAANHKFVRSIRSIEQIDDSEGVCFRVDHKDSLFICGGNSAIVTHNSVMCAYIALSVLYGKSEICKLWTNTPIHVHMITESFGKQKEVTQEKFAEITDYIFDTMGSCSDPNIKIYRHSGVIKEIHHLKTRNRIKFSSAQEGQKGLVGLEPHLLILDEPIPQEAYDELIARVRKPKARFLMCCTALNANHAWIIYRAKELLELERQGKTVEGRYVVTARSIDNPHFPLAQIENWKREWGEDDIRYRVRVLGELELLDGLVMPDFTKNVVPNHYAPEYTRNSQNTYDDFIWLEAADYGSYEGTLIVWAKMYYNGEIVVENEWYQAKNSHLPDWVKAYQHMREELGVPVIYEQINGSVQPKVWKNVNRVYRKPASSIADGAELQKSDKSTGLKLRNLFALNEIYITQSPKTNIEFGLTILNSLFKDGKIKIKERCFNLIEHGRKHVYRTNDVSGKTDTKSPHDISMDVLRYLIQSTPLQPMIASYVKAQEYKFKMITDSDVFVDKYRTKQKPNSI